MSLIQYDERIIDKVPELFDHVQNSYIQNLVTYMIDSKYRKTRILKSWLKEQVDSPSQELLELAESIKGNDYDTIAINCLRKVQSIITYKSDDLIWSMPEYWQTAQETLTLKTGDCEDGAILMYVLCRLKGIPNNRLLLFCGDVSGGGHCWLGYKPKCYPLNFVFLDWCYWYKANNIDLRNKFYVNNNIIYEYDYEGRKVNSNYYKAWFVFNEDYNVKNYKYVIGRDNK